MRPPIATNTSLLPVADDGADDATLILRSRQEPECFAALFRRHVAAIQRYVVRRLGPDAADDVVAETFLTAFTQRGQYQDSRPDARPWLYGIATNLIGRYRRAELRQYRVLARTGTDPVTEPFTDRVDAVVSAGRASRRLAAALARLPAGHRDALLLVAWGDLTYEQAALALGVPVGTVRSRLSRARGSLRRVLGDLDPSAPSEQPDYSPGLHQEDGLPSGPSQEPGPPPANHEETSHD
jgi:RNA polymerase sigma factor (sigma-70 family)